MGSFNQFCRYCNQIVPGDAKTCPHCSRINPLMARCPKCLAPTRSFWKSCSSCGISLEIICPKCNKPSFFDDYCQHCNAQLAIECANPKCRFQQPPVAGKCKNCGKPLQISKEK